VSNFFKAGCGGCLAKGSSGRRIPRKDILRHQRFHRGQPMKPDSQIRPATTLTKLTRAANDRFSPLQILFWQGLMPANQATSVMVADKSTPTLWGSREPCEPDEAGCLLARYPTKRMFRLFDFFSQFDQVGLVEGETRARTGLSPQRILSYTGTCPPVSIER
jgi:hypothetical protein